MQNSNFIQSHLGHDEYIAWSAKPDYKKIFDFNDIFIIPITLLFLISVLVQLIPGCTLNLGFISIKNTRDSWDVLSYYMIPVLIVSLYLFIGRFFVRINRMKNTEYYLTNKRVVIYANRMFSNKKDLIRSNKNSTWTVSAGVGNFTGTQVKNIDQIGKIIGFKNIYGGIDIKFIQYRVRNRSTVYSMTLKNIENAELVMDLISELKAEDKYNSFGRKDMDKSYGTKYYL